MIVSVRYLAGWGLLLCLLRTLALGQDLPKSRADLLEAASELQSLEPLDIWQNMPGGQAGADDVNAADRRVLDRLAISNYSSGSLISLLDDPSPRVRTLALALLFDKEDPQLLPYIATRLTDETQTFVVLQQLSAIIGPPPVPRAQTVADFARALLRMYVRRVSGEEPSFDNYWEARKNRSYCLSWLYVRYLGAAGLSIPLTAKAEARVAGFRKELGALPPVDRDLYLIWLQSLLSEPDLASDAAVVDRENKRTAAPHYGETIVSPSYSVTAARLLPARAESILGPAVQANFDPNKPDERSRFAAALLQLRGKSAIAFVRGYFFSAAQEQLDFIQSTRLADRPLVETLLDDPRLPSVTPQVMASVQATFPDFRHDLFRR